MEQEIEKRKENKKRKLVRAFIFSWFGFIMLIMVLYATGTQLQKGTEIEGRVLFTFNNHGDYLIVLTNQIISAPTMTSELQGNFDIWDELQKNPGSDTLNVNSNEQLWLNFQLMEQRLERRRKSR